MQNRPKLAKETTSNRRKQVSNRDMPDIIQEAGMHAREVESKRHVATQCFSPKQWPVVAIGRADSPHEAGGGGDTLTIVKGPFRGARTQGGQGLKRHGGLQRRHISPRNSPHLASNVPGTASARYTHLRSTFYRRRIFSRRFLALPTFRSDRRRALKLS